MDGLLNAEVQSYRSVNSGAIPTPPGLLGEGRFRGCSNRA